MILKHIGGGEERARVTEAKTGRRFDTMELDAEDFDKLSTLTSHQLSAWLELWRLGFRRGLRT